MKDFFKPEDFESYACPANERPCVAFARIANAKLAKLIESWPVVFCTKRDSLDNSHWTASEKKHEIDTHKARLAFIEELPKESCKHTPSMSRFGKGNWEVLTNESGDFVCAACGIELVAEWREKK